MDLWDNPMQTDRFEFVEYAAAALKRARELGAWAVESHPGPMELNIPAIKGIGDSLIYLVDRYPGNEGELSIYDVDFKWLTGERKPAGFGEGNFRALFESMELDQIRRGVLDPARPRRRISSTVRPPETPSGMDLRAGVKAKRLAKATHPAAGDRRKRCDPPERPSTSRRSAARARRHA